MIYAIRMNPVTRTKTLIECRSYKELDKFQEEEPFEYWYYQASRAHDWVRNGNPHETGLWVDDQGKVRYAKPNQ